MREKPVVCLVHGAARSDHSGYKPRFSALSDAMQLIDFDHRGQGRSVRDGDSAFWTRMSRRWVRFGFTLGLGRVVVGTNSGGRVVTASAARLPASVLRLVLVAAAAPARVLAGQHGWICPREFAKEIASPTPASRCSSTRAILCMLTKPTG